MGSYKHTRRRDGIFRKKRNVTKRIKNTLRKSRGRVMKGGMKIKYEDGNERKEYNGDVNNQNEPNGRGIMLWADDTVYYGHWINGKREGRGRIQYPNGKIYFGDWNDDKIKDGICRMKWPNGEVYYGECFRGKRHGRGIGKYPTGAIYVGNWNDDKKQTLTNLIQKSNVSKIAFHPKKSLLLAVCQEENDQSQPTLVLQRFNQYTGEITDNICLSKCKGNDDGDTVVIHHSSTIAFHPTIPIFAVGNNEIGEICLFEWNINEQSRLFAKMSCKIQISSVYMNICELIAFHPTQLLFATYGIDSDGGDIYTTRIFQINKEDASSAYTLDLHCEIKTDGLTCIDFHPKQPILMTAFAKTNKVLLWNYNVRGLCEPEDDPEKICPIVITVLTSKPHIEPRESLLAYNSVPSDFHRNTVTFVAFHPNDWSIFATCSNDKTIKIWRMAPPPVKDIPSDDILKMMVTCMATFDPPEQYSSPVTCVAFHPTVLLLVGGYSNGNVMLIELEPIYRKKVLDTKPMAYQEYGLACLYPPPLKKSDEARSHPNQAIVSTVNFQVDADGVTFLKIGRCNTNVVEIHNVSLYVSDIRNRKKKIFSHRRDVITELTRQFMSPSGKPFAMPREGSGKMTPKVFRSAIQRLSIPTSRSVPAVVHDSDWQTTLDARRNENKISHDELDSEEGEETDNSWRRRFEEAERQQIKQEIGPELKRELEQKLKLKGKRELESQPSQSKGGNRRRTRRKNRRNK